VQTLYSVSSLGYHRLSGEGKDLEQARLAIEAMKALLPVLEGAVSAERPARLQPGATRTCSLAYASRDRGGIAGLVLKTRAPFSRQALP
jgi:hypothetical protein